MFIIRGTGMCKKIVLILMMGLVCSPISWAQLQESSYEEPSDKETVRERVVERRFRVPASVGYRRCIGVTALPAYISHGIYWNSRINSLSISERYSSTPINPTCSHINADNKIL